jgi:hypothetical protein
VERVGDSVVPRFEVVSRPDAWLVEVQGGAPAETMGMDAFVASCFEGFRDRARQILAAWTA